jgi:hypothetical protein
MLPPQTTYLLHVTRGTVIAHSPDPERPGSPGSWQAVAVWYQISCVHKKAPVLERREAADRGKRRAGEGRGGYVARYPGPRSDVSRGRWWCRPIPPDLSLVREPPAEAEHTVLELAALFHAEVRMT